MPSQSSATLSHACINSDDENSDGYADTAHNTWLGPPCVKCNIVAPAKRPPKMHNSMCKHVSSIHNTSSLTTEQQM